MKEYHIDIYLVSVLCSYPHIMIETSFVGHSPGPEVIKLFLLFISTEHENSNTFQINSLQYDQRFIFFTVFAFQRSFRI